MRSDLAGTTCVLTKTNEEALQVTCLLLKNNVQAKLIQSNDGFSLYDLVEVRFFLDCLRIGDGIYVITDEVWDNAVLELRNNFGTSTKLELCLNMIKDFEASNPTKKYKSDLETFIRESKLDDFFNENGETVFVSTMHKAKGREFTNIFIMLDHFNINTDESKRLLYVAMTRAKENLSIHLNSNILGNLVADNLERFEDAGTYLPPEELVMHLTFKDVWLDYFITRQHLMTDLRSGDNLRISSDACTTERGQPVLKFSTAFLSTIEAQRQRGYLLTKVRVNFIVYWQKEGSGEEIKIVLPEVHFEKGVVN
jgi:ATP-dependent DNA helicase RecQ